VRGFSAAFRGVNFEINSNDIQRFVCVRLESPMNPDYCPNCGEAVPRKAKACPECGACEETGWSDDAESDRLGTPKESFDYDDFVKREFGDDAPPPRKFGKLWAVVAIILLALFATALFR
jgi:hypothetical protein